jgi:menaquinone-dependent protoporphyrinogen oxidase
MTLKPVSIKRISRRRFLIGAGVAAAGSCLACSGLAYLASETTQAPEPETPSFTFIKDSSMNQRILVTYATRTGSTVGVAETIGKTLGLRGYAVDVKPLKENPSAAGYQAVIIGSAINGAHWLPEAVQFVQDHQAELSRVPVALFCVHIMNLGSDEGSRAKRLAYLDPIRKLIKPRAEAFFAGMGMKPEETNGFTRWVYRTFKIGPEGDCRDWDKIRGWAQQVFA